MFGKVLIAASLALAAPTAPTAPPTTLSAGPHHAIVDGVRLWYRVAGKTSGTPVVFLHGGPGEGSQTFARFAGPLLERDLRMVYLDQRGSGRSERPFSKAYSIPLIVEDLERLRLQWGVERLDLVGHSFGTVIALEYAAKFPAHVDRMVLTGTVVDVPAAVDLQCARLETIDPVLYAKAVAALDKGSPRKCEAFGAGQDFVNANMYPDPATRKIVDDSDSADGLGNTGEIGQALFAQGFLDYRFTKGDRLTMPVLAIGGDKDFQAVDGPVKAFVKTLPNGRYVGYPGRGHFMFVEDPARFAKDVVAFLAPPKR
jgi:proline iminopeptidase